jgi:cytochrome c2
MVAHPVKISRDPRSPAAGRPARERPLRGILAAMLAGGAVGLLGGCGGAGQGKSEGTGASEAASAGAHFTRQQELVEEGGRLFISDGCTGCHTLDAHSRFGPSFAHLAGSTVTLADGRRVLVDERFLHAALLDPAANAVRGYSPAPMIAAVGHLMLATHGEEVAALAAFIEQIGPENG